MSVSSEATEKLDFKKVLPILVVVLVDLLGLTVWNPPQATPL